MPLRMRWTAYAGVSTALAGGVVLKALAQRPNFYSATVYLSQSSANLMILTNLVFVTACTLLLGLQKLLYGPLRPIEVEQLYEKGWFAVTETCLAMTIFRGEIGAWFLVMFFALLTGKVWGWMGEGRVEMLEQQPPRNPRLFHTRLALSLGLSVAFDMTMLEYVVKQVMRMARPDMTVMFGFEFAILTLSSLSTAARYAINLVEIGIVRDQKRTRGLEMQKERLLAASRDLQRAEQATVGGSENTVPEQPDVPAAGSTPPPTLGEAREALRIAQQPVDETEIEVEGWESKGRWIFYLDLSTDFFKLVVYLSFFFIILIFYGIPIHIFRDVFMTGRSFFQRLRDFFKYRTATRDMNSRYPDATAEELGREDVCIICREEMRLYVPQQNGQTNPVAERMRPKKLPCGHILHFSCLRSWLERQQICPTCRREVIPTQRPAAPGAGPQAGGGRDAAGQAHPAGDRQGARVFQLGPLRIGVGAARGNNMFEEIQQQLGDGRAGPLPPANPNGPQQYGFGIRWDAGNRRRARRLQPATVREQLGLVERQIQQEIQTLGQDMRELGALRQMQLELDRIRSQRSGNVQAQQSSANNAPPAVSGGPRHSPVSMLESSHNDTVLQAGSDQLPEGLTLPEGWSMLPLHPAAAPPPPPQIAGLRNFYAPMMPQQPWNPGMPFPMPAFPGAMLNGPAFPAQGHQLQNIRAPGQQPGIQQPNGQVMTQTTQANVNGISSSVEGQPAAGAALHPDNLGFMTATQLHEQYLASLRVPQLDQEQNGSTQVSPHAPTTNGPLTTSNESTLQASETTAPFDTPRSDDAPLPSWGSASASTSGPLSNVSDADAHIDTGTNGSGMNGFAEAGTSAARSSGSEGKDRSATVEDLVEGPD